jgi:hypothetical protein
VVAPATILLGPEALVDWGAPPLAPTFYHDLCALVEAIVLYDRLLVFGLEFQEPLAVRLREAGLLIDAKPFLDRQLEANLTLSYVDNKLTLSQTPAFMACAGALVDMSIALQPMVNRYLDASLRSCAALGVEEQASHYARIATSFDSWLLGTESGSPKTIDLLAGAPEELKRMTGPAEISSRELMKSIRHATTIQTLAGMAAQGIHVVPHSFDGAGVIRTARDTIYQRIVETHREQSTGLLEKYQRNAIHHQIVPPLMHELLTRCRGDRHAFADELLALREKYVRLRESQHEYFSQIASARSLIDYQRIEKTQERVWSQLTKQISAGEHKWRWALRSAWSYLRLLNPKDIAVKALEDVSTGISNWNVARTASSFYSLYRDAGHADLHVDLMAKTFGRKIDRATVAE